MVFPCSMGLVVFSFLCAVSCFYAITSASECGAHVVLAAKMPHTNLAGSRSVGLVHFLNSNNSCAVDSFLDLSFFCYRDLLQKRDYSGCSVLDKSSLACANRRKQISLPQVRQPVWDLLSSTVPSFAVQGSLNPAISDIFSQIGISAEEDFCLRISRSGRCSDCGNPLNIPDSAYCPLWLSPKLLKESNNDVQSAIDNFLLSNHSIRRQFCVVCERRCNVSDFDIVVKCPEVCLIEIPVVLANVTTPNTVSEEVIDLTVPSCEPLKQQSTTYQYVPPIVIDDIAMKFHLNIADLGYEMCGAVRGRRRHFSIAASINGTFRQIDDMSVDTPVEVAFNCFSQGAPYQTNQRDGYFIFLYRTEGSLLSNNDVPYVGITGAPSCSQQYVPATTNSLPSSLTANTGECGTTGSRTQPSPPNPCAGKMRKNQASDKPQSKTKPKRSRVDKILYDQENAPPTEKTDIPIDIRSIQSSFMILRGRPFLPIRVISAFFAHERSVIFRADSLLAKIFKDPSSELLLSPFGKKTHISASAMAYLVCHINTGSTNCQIRCDVWREIGNIVGKVVLGEVLEGSAAALRLNSLLGDYVLQSRTELFVQVQLFNAFCNIPSNKLKSVVRDFLKKVGLEVEHHVMSQGNATCLSLEAALVFLCSRRKYSIECRELVDAITTAFEQAMTILSPERTPFTDVQNRVSQRTPPPKLTRDSKKHARHVMDSPNENLPTPSVNAAGQSNRWTSTPQTPVMTSTRQSIATPRIPLSENTKCVPQELQSRNATGRKIVDTPKSSRKVSTFSLTQSSTTGKSIDYNRCLAGRVKQQRLIRKELTENLHGGSKESYIASIRYELSHGHSRSTGGGDTWNGSLSSEDFIGVLDSVATKSGVTLLEKATKDKLPQLNPEDAIGIVDCHSGYSLMNQLRKAFPGQLPSMYAINKCSKYLYQEYQAVLQPSFIPHRSFTKCGIKVDPFRLLQCLRQLYYYLTDDESWRIWGDGREIGKRSSCVMSVSCINHEQRLHNFKYHSPKDIWPLCIFYGDDHRWNLEANIGRSGGRPGWLNDWVHQEQTHPVNYNGKAKSVNFYLTGDAPFIDAIKGGPGELSATSKEGFNVYMKCDRNSMGDVHPGTGFRSGLGKTFDRVLPNSLLPSIPLSRVVFCIDHATTRIVEKLIKKKLQTIALMSTDNADPHQKKDYKKMLDRYKENLKLRGIKKANRYIINRDGTLKETPTLNKTEAHVLLYGTDSFDRKYPSLLEGVTDTEPTFTIDDKCQQALGWDSNNVSELQLESEIWNQLSTAIFLLRGSDPEPKLKSGLTSKSSDPDDYCWGLTKSQIDNVCHSLDLFHKLYLIRYGTSEITPYMIKLVDVTPILLKQLPYPVMRFSTEGGEHMHYSQACYYFQHTSRGGGHKTKETIQSILFWHYRQLRSRILAYITSDNKLEQEAGRKFHQWIRREWAATIFSKVWRGRKSRIAVRALRESGNAPSQPVQQAENHALDIIIVGPMTAAIRKLGNRDQVRDLLETKSLRLLRSDANALPNEQVPITITIVTQQSQCDLAKPPRVLIEAMCRKWPIVGFNYISAVVSNSLCLPAVDKFLLNFDALLKLPEVINPTLSIQRRNFERPCDLHPITQAKKRKISKQSATKPKIQKPGQFQNCRSSYAAYFAKNYNEIPEKARSMKAKHEYMKSHWSAMSEEEKSSWEEVLKNLKGKD